MLYNQLKPIINGIMIMVNIIGFPVVLALFLVLSRDEYEFKEDIKEFYKFEWL